MQLNHSKRYSDHASNHKLKHKKYSRHKHTFFISLNANSPIQTSPFTIHCSGPKKEKWAFQKFELQEIIKHLMYSGDRKEKWKHIQNNEYSLISKPNDQVLTEHTDHLVRFSLFCTSTIKMKLQNSEFTVIQLYRAGQHE